MIDFEQARRTMVDCQIRPSDVTDHRVLAAFLDVPREEFVDSAQRPLAYIDEDLPLAGSDSTRFFMEPRTLAKLVQLAALTPDDVVLDIGCETGYSSAVLSRLCSSVVAVESDEALCERATDTLAGLSFDNVAVVNGKLTDGYAKEGPYDTILLAGAVDEVPEPILKQLKDGGRLVTVVGTGNSGRATVFTRNGELTSEHTAFDAAVERLPGFEREAGFVF